MAATTFIVRVTNAAVQGDISDPTHTLALDYTAQRVDGSPVSGTFFRILDNPGQPHANNPTPEDLNGELITEAAAAVDAESGDRAILVGGVNIVGAIS